MRVPRALLLLALLAAPGRAAAQEAEPERALEPFVREVAGHWAEGDSGALVELLPGSGRLLLDAGTGTGTVDGRLAEAALRALFGAREGGAVRAERVSLSGGTPPRGFGELAWRFRTRGSPSSQERSVYVGTVWEDGRWRIAELRVMP